MRQWVVYAKGSDIALGTERAETEREAILHRIGTINEAYAGAYYAKTKRKDVMVDQFEQMKRDTEAQVAAIPAYAMPHVPGGMATIGDILTDALGLVPRPRAEPAPDMGKRAMVTLAKLHTAVMQHDAKLDDPRGDGSGTDSQCPTGDDYNEIYGEVEFAWASMTHGTPNPGVELLRAAFAAGLSMAAMHEAAAVHFGTATVDQIEAVKMEHCDDECEIAESALVSEADDGLWVLGWLWVTHSEVATARRVRLAHVIAGERRPGASNSGNPHIAARQAAERALAMTGEPSDGPDTDDEDLISGAHLTDDEWLALARAEG